MTPRRPAPVDLVVDSSAVLAILLGEEPARRLTDALRVAQGPVVSAATLAELTIVAEARVGTGGAQAAWAVLDAGNVVPVPVDSAIADASLDAWRRFGKGNHPAGLNFGDCFSYATAVHYDVPLLCVGADFARTDLRLIDVMPAAGAEPGLPGQA